MVRDSQHHRLHLVPQFDRSPVQRSESQAEVRSLPLKLCCSSAVVGIGMVFLISYLFIRLASTLILTPSVSHDFFATTTLWVGPLHSIAENAVHGLNGSTCSTSVFIGQPPEVDSLSPTPHFHLWVRSWWFERG